MSNLGASGSGSLSPSHSAVFDPPKVTVTKELNTYWYTNNGDKLRKPMLNNYVRYAKVGGGQHGEVFLCYKQDNHYPEDDARRWIPMVRLLTCGGQVLSS